MNTKPSALVVDDDEQYRVAIKDALNTAGFAVSETNDPEEARECSGTDLIVLDDRYGKGASYWKELIAPLRCKNPDATLLLVSRYDDDALKADVKELDEAAKSLLGSDPFIQYLPKGADALGKTHLARIKTFGERLVEKLADRRTLQSRLLECALGAAKEIVDTKLAELIKAVGTDDKPDTYQMDVITERFIKETFVGDMHYKEIVICTEEEGVHNELFHRVGDPRFYILSDPFDGSSAFRQFAKQMVDEGQGARLPRDIARDPDLLRVWERSYGSPSLNAPMVSIVLAERHKVTGAVLVNLFTGDVYLSVDSGNYFASASDFAAIPEGTRAAIEANAPLTTIGGWKKMEFKTHHELSGEPLFLCSLGAKKRAAGERTWINKHAEACVGPILPPQYHWKTSFDHRRDQGDFTPGPGRVLFLARTARTQAYESSSLNGNSYHCVLSAGEPLTEWIGWFAFLRHTRGISAYCLRQNGDPLGHCSHRHNDASDPATLIPDELASIFRDGYMDLGVLHTAYGRNMRRYHDTLLVVFDADKAWQPTLTRKGKGRQEGQYVRIPLFQRSSSQ